MHVRAESGCIYPGVRSGALLGLRDAHRGLPTPEISIGVVGMHTKGMATRPAVDCEASYGRSMHRFSGYIEKWIDRRRAVA